MKIPLNTLEQPKEIDRRVISFCLILALGINLSKP